MFQTLLLLFACHAPAAVKVAIDPGHGGSDRGAVYAHVEESLVALQVSKYLYEKLKRDKNFKAYLLRKSDKDLALEDRVHRSEKLNVDIFISIHANANPNKKIHGAEFYIQNQMPIEEESLFLANRENDHHHHHKKAPSKEASGGPVESILFDLAKTQKILKSYELSRHLRKSWPLGERKRKRYMIRQGPFYVLSQTEKPAVLVEVGYLSHSKDRLKLTDKKYQKKVAQQIYRGLLSYVKNMDK